MFNRQSLRLGLTGAVLFIILGSLTACSDSSPTEPAVAQYDTTGNCIVLNGVLICQ